jgi:hypothetical protein
MYGVVLNDMKIPKEIENQLAKRGWTMTEGEKWRKVRSLDWACAYFNYRNRVCLITVAKSTFYYSVQILYAHPVCSMYSYNIKSGFNISK